MKTGVATSARRAVVVLLGLGLAACATGDGAGGQEPRTSAPRPPVDLRPRADAKALAELGRRGAPLSEQRDGLRGYLAGRGLTSKTIAAVLRHTRDGIVLRRGPERARTRLGGRPVLPPGEPWPTDGSGNPFTFLAAFDFAEMPRLDPLPHEGTLALYWNFLWHEDTRDGAGEMDFVAATRSYYFAPGDEVVHREPPFDSWPVGSKPLRGYAMPIAGDPWQVAEEVAGSSDRDATFDALNGLLAVDLYPHHLLGAPIEIQGPVLDGMPSLFDPRRRYFSEESRARFTADERNSGEWLLLAQINEDDDLVIADGGVLHFVMLASDLAARRFDRVIGVMESH